MPKFKVRIDKRDEGDEPVEFSMDNYALALHLAGWSDDPGEGKAILLGDGRELLNPVPHDPPIGYKPEPSIMELVNTMIKRHLAGLDGDEEVDSPEDAMDLDMPDDEGIPYSPYDIEMMDEFPSMPAGAGEIVEAEPEPASTEVAEPPAKPERKKPRSDGDLPLGEPRS